MDRSWFEDRWGNRDLILLLLSLIAVATVAHWSAWRMADHPALPRVYADPIVVFVQRNDTLWGTAEQAVACGAMRCGPDLREAVYHLEQFNPGLSAALKPGDRIVIPITNPDHPPLGALAALLGAPPAEARLAP